MQFDRTVMRRLMALITFTLLLLALLMRFDRVLAACRFLTGILSPFLIGGAMAFILNVLMRFIEERLLAPLFKKRRPKYLRALSLLLTLTVITLLILLLLLVVLPQLTATVAGLGATISAGVNRLVLWAEDQFASNPQILQWLDTLEFDWQKILNSALTFLRSGAGSMLNSTITAAKSVFNGFVNFFVAFVFAIYLLIQKEKLGLQCRKALYALLPKRAADRTVEIARLTCRVFMSFITGQCMEAVILGAMFFVSMTIFRMPYALLVSCLIAVTALIPIVGAFIGCGVGVFLLLLDSPVKALTFLVLFLVLQQLEGNLIYPHVVGSSVGLPSIWVLAAVSIGGSLLGVVGMLVFIPLTSVAYTLFREFVYRRLRERKLRIR